MRKHWERQKIQKDRLERLREFIRIREALKQKDFAKFCLIVGREYGINDIPEFQQEWIDALKKHNRIVIFSPIEHGKSTIMSLLYPLWRLGLDPNLRVVIISDTDRQASKFLYAIKQKILYCPKLKKFFPELKPIELGSKIWSSRSIIIERDSLSEKEPSIQAIGCRGAILGARLDLVIADDVLNDKNTSTVDWIEKTKRWWNAIITSRLTEKSQVVFIGNAWDHRDLAHTLARSGSYHVINQQAIKDGKPIFPQVWSLKRLAQRRKELQDDVEYKRQFFNICPSISQSRISVEAIEDCIDESLELKQKPIGFDCYVGVDLSGGKAKDLTCIFTIAQDIDYKIRVVDIEVGRWEINEIIRRININKITYDPKLIYIEANVGQSYVTQILQEKGLDVTPFYTSTNKIHRKYGIESMINEIAERKWRIPSKSFQEVEMWINEVLAYENHKHAGDRLMASWIARQALRSDEMISADSGKERENPVIDNYVISNQKQKSKYYRTLRTDLWK